MRSVIYNKKRDSDKQNSNQDPIMLKDLEAKKTRKAPDECIVNPEESIVEKVS
jgi:hypothetical protein